MRMGMEVAHLYSRHSPSKAHTKGGQSGANLGRERKGGTVPEEGWGWRVAHYKGVGGPREGGKTRRAAFSWTHPGTRDPAARVQVPGGGGAQRDFGGSYRGGRILRRCAGKIRAPSPQRGTHPVCLKNPGPSPPTMKKVFDSPQDQVAVWQGTQG